MPELNQANTEDFDFMRQAINEANKALALDEVPIGAVLVDNINAKIIAASHNLTLTLKDATAHAEINAIRQASIFRANHRLINTTLYVTLEPCLMCFGAIIQARIARVVYGANDNRFSVCQPLFNNQNLFRFNHMPKISHGVFADECSTLLSDFFKTKRHN